MDIFVFGSNLLGIHKKGAALTALNEHNAIMGQGSGLQGESYAIPTKATPAITLPLCDINNFVAEFISYAEYACDDGLNFIVTKIGCGLAGYEVSDIAPMFYYALDSDGIVLPEEFIAFLKK